MRVLVETFYDDKGIEIGELVIESDALGYTVVHYSASFTKKDGVATDTHVVISSANYLSVAGCCKNILNRKIKEVPQRI